MYSLAALPDGRLASASADSTIRLWQNERCAATLTGHSSGVLDLVVLPSGVLAGADGGGGVWLWL